MSLLKSNAVQIGQSLTPTNNFVWYFFMDLRFLLVSGSLGRLYSIEFVFSMMMMLFDFSRFEFEIRLRLWRVLSMASKRGFTIETFLPLILMNRSSSY